MRRTTLAPEAFAALRTGAVVVRDAPAVFELRGPGAVQCLQGTFTNDVVKPGDHALTYGAFLTPKGMIIADAWVLRLPDRLLIVTDSTARDPLRQIFDKSLPPRLARAEDLGDRCQALWILGRRAVSIAAEAGLPVPEREGAVGLLGVGPGAPLAARATPGAPFGLLCLAGTAALDPLAAALAAAGARTGEAEEQDAARVLAGWPRLGEEIQERTLPQEVRFDEIGGVSYTKGCYTGQETVARLHFRGHTNREMRGLAWDGVPVLTGEDVTLADGKEVGVTRSVVDLPDRSFGLAIIRREIAPNTILTAGGRAARVVALPFDLDHPGA